jgi:hypothetical protein
MPDARLLHRLVRAQAELDKAGDALAAASRTRTRQVRAALLAGHSYGAVARSLGLTRAAVQSIAGPVGEWRTAQAPESTVVTLPPLAEPARCVRIGCTDPATKGRLCQRHHTYG